MLSATLLFLAVEYHEYMTLCVCLYVVVCMCVCMCVHVFVTLLLLYIYYRGMMLRLGGQYICVCLPVSSHGYYNCYIKMVNTVGHRLSEHLCATSMLIVFR